jgi:predicted glycosyltransferase
MILGGPNVRLPETDVTFHQLPGLMMDSNFSKLIPCDADQDLEQIKKQRKEQLFNLFTTFKPDIFLVELFPFGRKAFGFELNPILTGIAEGTLSPCLRLCSLRDILVEKKDKRKYEMRVLNSLNTSFDGLLIHSDPDYIPLDHTFSLTDSIAVPVKYTGFITPKLTHTKQNNTIRQQLKLSQNAKLVVASIGGGNVGAELLLATAATAELLDKKKQIHFHFFTGPYSDSELLDELKKYESSHLHVHSFCDNFPEWLHAADLSISMAGYNTCMNLLEASIPALLHPFAQNREQRMRIAAFSNCCDFTLLETDDLHPEKLTQLICEKLKHPKKSNCVDLDGAVKSSELISDVTLWNPK